MWSAFCGKNKFFPKPEMASGLPGTIWCMKFGSKPMAGMDILGAAKTSKFSGKITLHTGLPPGGPDAFGDSGATRKNILDP